ncbi:hypothetical protein GCM10010388_72640 [Streptomyces mauvecolor]
MGTFLGGLSLGCWFCCLTWLLALPLATAGLAVSARAFLLARREGVGAGRAGVDLALCGAGFIAGLAYWIYYINNPDRPIWD